MHTASTLADDSSGATSVTCLRKNKEIAKLRTTSRGIPGQDRSRPIGSWKTEARSCLCFPTPNRPGPVLPWNPTASRTKFCYLFVLAQTSDRRRTTAVVRQRRRCVHPSVRLQFPPGAPGDMSLALVSILEQLDWETRDMEASLKHATDGYYRLPGVL